MLILSLHSGPHDSSAALFEDYRVLAAVAEERLNRVKGSGGFPEQSIAEVLRIAGASVASSMRSFVRVRCSSAITSRITGRTNGFGKSSAV